jgi:DNA-directed RNA polymerase specialized sigma24 family protein
MPAETPGELSRLLEARGDLAHSEAWEAFVRKYSRLLMHVSRSLADGYDGAMDRYAHILEQLCRDDCKRLRKYAVQPQTEFTTWLVVVARRMCTDHQRGRYGRQRLSGEPNAARAEEIVSRRRMPPYTRRKLTSDRTRRRTRTSDSATLPTAHPAHPRRSTGGARGGRRPSIV